LDEFPKILRCKQGLAAVPMRDFRSTIVVPPAIEGRDED
jgi:hypothetical protein